MVATVSSCRLSLQTTFVWLDHDLEFSALVANAEWLPVSVDIVPGRRKGLPSFTCKRNVADLLDGTNSPHSSTPVGFGEEIGLEERRRQGESLEGGSTLVADQVATRTSF